MLFNDQKHTISTRFVKFWRNLYKTQPESLRLPISVHQIVLANFSIQIPYTEKMMCAAIHGFPVVEYKWISDSLAKGKLMPIQNYLFSEKDDVKSLFWRYSFDLGHLEQAKHSNGKLGGVLNLETLSNVITGCGGNVVKNNGEEEKDDDRRLITLGVDKSFNREKFTDSKKSLKEGKSEMKGEGLVDYRWVVDSIIHRELQDRHLYMFDESN